MDFPVCPACGQSVIDDDVDDCPFCGSSMKAKPGAKPAAPKPTASAGAKPGATAAKPGSSPAAKPSSPNRTATGPKSGGKSSDADDFPFDADLPASKAAIQAMPNATKQRSLKVVCPMCETAGYVPPSAAGQEVKCANPKCMVPVFKAPAAVVEAPPPPKKKSNLPMILGGIVVVAGIAAAGIFVLPGLLASRPKPTGMSDEDKALMAEMAQGKTTKTDQPVTSAETGNASTKTSEEDKPNAGPKSPDELIAAALKTMKDACLVSDRRQRSKPFCRQMTAEANALAGDVAGAREHLSQLIVVGRDVPYYRITPNLELFWSELAAGDKAAAVKSLDAAVADVSRLPKVGRNQLEIAGRIAAALAAMGRVPEALEILKGHQSETVEGQLAARLQMASDGQLTRLTGVRTVLPWTAPQAVAATATLVARGQPKAARDWALAQPTEDAKSECLAVWAEGIARLQTKPGSADSNPELVDAVKGLAPQLAARVWARAACGRIAAKDLEGGTATLKIAHDLLATVTVPAEPTMPDIKQTMKFELPAAQPLVQAATAAAEIAFAQTLSPSTVKDGEASLDQALQFARGIAPGWPAASQRANEAEQMGASGLQAMLKRELSLKTDDDARLAVGRYRRALTDITDASKQRFELQTQLLIRLAKAGLKEKAWLVVSTRTAESDASRRDNFLETRLTAELLEAFQGTETAKAIAGALSSEKLPVRPALAQVREFLKQGDGQSAAALVNESNGDDIALMLTTWLATTDKVGMALQFIGQFDDIVLREEAYRLVAGLAAQRGQAEIIWKQIGIATQATERVALCRGLIGGLKSPAPAEDLPEPAITQ